MTPQHDTMPARLLFSESARPAASAVSDSGYRRVTSFHQGLLVLSLVWRRSPTLREHLGLNRSRTLRRRGLHNCGCGNFLLAVLFAAKSGRLDLLNQSFSELHVTLSSCSSRRLIVKMRIPPCPGSAAHDARVVDLHLCLASAVRSIQACVVGRLMSL